MYGGEAISRLPDGRAVFVPFTLPGETARVKLIEEKRGFARAELLEILDESPNRVPPRCIHYGVCGGCHYQHIPYSLQLQSKEDILQDQLARIGGFADPPLKPIVPSPQQYNYRNHVQFHLDAAGKLGYQTTRSHDIIPIKECHLPEPALNELWPQLDFEPLPDLDRIGLRAGADDQLMLVLQSSSDQAYHFSVDFPISAVQIGPTQVHVLSQGHTFEMEVLDQRLQLSADAFFQVNTAMAEEMIQYLLDHLPLNSDTLLLDVFCGVGLFSLFLAPKVSRLIGIESHPGAVIDFEANLERFDNVELYEATAEQVLPQLDEQPDIVLVDPPRAGLAKEVIDAILQMRPSLLAYVSCDPATLARDAKRLSRGGFTLQEITPFDLFPQTYHIESISFWHME